MARSVNIVQLLGYLGADPERLKGDGMAFNVATSEEWTDDSGNKQERVDWHRCVMFSPKRSAALAKILRRSSRVHITGTLRCESYTDSNNVQRRSVDVIVRDVVLLDASPEASRSTRRDTRDNPADTRAPR